jgi:hypothetical protein
MQSKRPWSLVVAVGLVLVLGAHAEAQMAKQGTYAGNFGWYAIGKTFELEKDHAFWVGEFSGTFFNEAGQGFLHGTSWVCPGVNDLTNGASTASQGYCVVTDKEGDKAFLVWKGGKGFEGTYQWTGGTVSSRANGSCPNDAKNDVLPCRQGTISGTLSPVAARGLLKPRGSDNGDYVNGAPLDYTGIILTPAFATSEPIAR